MDKLKNSWKNIIKVLLSAAGIWAAIRFSGECTEGIAKGIDFCIGVLVPSLFIFMILTAYMIKSGASEAFSDCTRPLSRLMRLPDEAGAAALLSMIGGYPIGAGCVSMLYEEGRLSESEAAKTGYIAVAAGPGFIINYVGRALLGNPAAGNILLISQIVSVLLTGIIVGAVEKCSPPKTRAKAAAGGAGAFVDSVRSAAGSALSMCAMVLLFSAITEVVSSALDKRAADIISGFLEVTTGCNRLSASSPLYVTAFFIGFGGLSVHFQIFSSLKNIKISKLRFFLYRIIEGIISAAATYILLMIAPMETAVFSSYEEGLTGAGSATLIGSGALILLSVIFIGSISNKKRRLEYVRNSRMVG